MGWDALGLGQKMVEGLSIRISSIRFHPVSFYPQDRPAQFVEAQFGPTQTQSAQQPTRPAVQQLDSSSGQWCAVCCTSAMLVVCCGPWT